MNPFARLSQSKTGAPDFRRRIVQVAAFLGAALVLAGCSDVMDPVKGLGDALRGLFESMPF